MCSLLFLISFQAVEVHIQPLAQPREFLCAALAGKLSDRACAVGSCCGQQGFGSQFLQCRSLGDPHSGSYGEEPIPVSPGVLWSSSLTPGRDGGAACPPSGSRAERSRALPNAPAAPSSAEPSRALPNGAEVCRTHQRLRVQPNRAELSRTETATPSSAEPSPVRPNRAESKWKQRLRVRGGLLAIEPRTDLVWDATRLPPLQRPFGTGAELGSLLSGNDRGANPAATAGDTGPVPGAGRARQGHRRRSGAAGPGREHRQGALPQYRCASRRGRRGGSCPEGAERWGRGPPGACAVRAPQPFPGGRRGPGGSCGLAGSRERRARSLGLTGRALGVCGGGRSAAELGPACRQQSSCGEAAEEGARRCSPERASPAGVSQRMGQLQPPRHSREIRKQHGDWPRGSAWDTAPTEAALGTLARQDEPRDRGDAAAPRAQESPWLSPALGWNWEPPPCREQHLACLPSPREQPGLAAAHSSCLGTSTPGIRAALIGDPATRPWCCRCFPVQLAEPPAVACSSVQLWN
ncbi:translation initiation factor IF-2-like [Pyrgilauda ruficollis]|uniref:translation initiation factor IF-2-like n=1 Tax=Pyrgilauda ruficollis TaxID=221976 RepID=UPI001B8817CF|nr:translation initiation factor IF-2-like [Pyrgilauda ruficollis]